MPVVIRTILVGICDCGCRPFVRVNGRFSIGMAMLMAMPMLVIMLLPVLMSELMSALSEKFSNILRNWDGH
jgi:hypothetical protein